MITSLTDVISPIYMSGQGDYSHYVAYLISEELVHTGSIQRAALLLAFYVPNALLTRDILLPVNFFALTFTVFVYP